MRYLTRLILIVSMAAIGAAALCQEPGTAPAPAPAQSAQPQTTSPQPQVPAVGPRALGPQPEMPGFGFPGGERRGGGRTYSMNFDRADIQSVVKFLSMISGVPIVVDPEVKGNVTILCSKRLTLAEVFDIINAALKVHGCTLIGALDSKVIRVVPLKKAVTDATGVGSGRAIGDGIGDQQLITQVVPLNNISSESLVSVLKPLVSSDQASIISVPATNTILLTDTAGNIKRLIKVTEDLDRDMTGVIVVEVYQCKHASADNLVNTLNALFETKKGTAATGSTAAAQALRNAMANRGRTTGGPAAPTGPQPTSPDASGQASAEGGLADLMGQVNVTSDTRTNRIVISGTRERINAALKVIEQLDVDTEPEVKVKTFPLEYADAQTCASQLNTMFEQPQGGSSGGGGFAGLFGGGGSSSVQSTTYAGLKRNVVTADTRTNSLIVTATDQNMKVFESIILQLDAPKVLSDATKVYPLKYAKADDLAKVLTNLFRGSTTTTGGGFGMAQILGLGGTASATADSLLARLRQITVISEPKTNSLLVTGPANTGPLMAELIEKLDKRTAQVFIEVAIVDVNLDKENKFGVEWEWKDTTGSAGNPDHHNVSTDFGLSKETSGLKYSILNNNLNILLHTLLSKENVKVLSTPSITTSDNVEAKISIGEDRPFVSSSTVSNEGNVVNTVEYKTVATALTVTPHVNGSSDVISLDVQQTINEVIGTEDVLNSPIIANREATTSINVQDGQTIVIGGIIKENRDRITRAVPILSSIPLVGELFKSTHNKTERRELMVFLTPHILRTAEDTDTVTNDAQNALSVDPPRQITTLGSEAAPAEQPTAGSR